MPKRIKEWSLGRRMREARLQQMRECWRERSQFTADERLLMREVRLQQMKDYWWERGQVTADERLLKRERPGYSKWGTDLSSGSPQTIQYMTLVYYELFFLGVPWGYVFSGNSPSTSLTSIDTKGLINCSSPMRCTYIVSDYWAFGRPQGSRVVLSQSKVGMIDQKDSEQSNKLTLWHNGIWLKSCSLSSARYYIVVNPQRMHRRLWYLSCVCVIRVYRLLKAFLQLDGYIDRLYIKIRRFSTRNFF